MACGRRVRHAASMISQSVVIALLTAIGLFAGLLCFAGYRLRQVAAERDRAALLARQRELALGQCVAERSAGLGEDADELDFVALSVGHDLRVPLSAIDGFAEILMQRTGSDAGSEAAGYLDRIRANSAQMRGLTEALLEYSRFARRAPEPQPVDMRATVLDCLEAVRGAHGERDVQVSLQDLPDCVADPMLVRQVWMKLLDNAFKFTSRCRHPQIEIGGSSDDTEVAYFVRDNGIGFDMDEADQLFKLLHRLDRASEYPGIGTGLALVRRIILRHGGHLGAEGEPDRGATIHFALPRPRS
jgi:signal transduction histidine kinase